MCSSKRKAWVIPFGGNGFVTTPTKSSEDEIITACGVENWESKATKIALFFHSQSPVRLLTTLRLSVQDGVSRIRVSMAHYNPSKNYLGVVSEAREIEIKGSEMQLVNCGVFDITTEGYVRLEISGVSSTGATFAEMTDAVLVSEEYPLFEETLLRFVSDPEDFYFGRRGPSVHLQFPLEGIPDCEYFYNEIYVPKDQDVLGAYFCAIGFSGGYFGIQVNSSTERRVLFSVWSEFNSDDPEEIPEEYKVRLIRKGDGVYVGEFGDEGAGAQSYLKHSWKTETSCKFIVQGRPIDSERTRFTAWFNDGPGWTLIASFEKPKVSTFLRDPYAFSENFEPDMGYIQRKCHFGNQWALTSAGHWFEITQATFSADATSAKETRMDVSGGVVEDQTHFFLQNCGFFSDRVVPGTEFCRRSSGSSPPLDTAALP